MADNDLPPGVYEQGKTWAQRAVSAVAEPLTRGLSFAIESALDTGLAPYSMKQPADAIAQAVIPQTPAQVGTTAATLATIPFTGGMSLPLAIGTRVGAGAAGGAVGGALGDEGALRGGLEGGVSTLIGEGIGLGVGLGGRATPGGKERAAKDLLNDLADQVGGYLPSLRGMTGPEIKKAVVSAKGGFKREIDDRYGAVLSEVETLIGNQKIRVPSLGETVREQRAIPSIGATEMVDAARPMTLTEAVDKLKALGHAGFGGGKDLNPSIVGKDMRTDWKQIIGEITDELNRINPSGEAAAAFLKGRQEWAVGKALIAALDAKGTLKGVPNDVLFNPNGLREAFERTYKRFERSLIPDELEALTNVIYRGGPFGSRDFLGPTSGVTDAAARFYRQGGGTGTTALTPIRTVLPGLGDQYTGRTPYQAPAGLQTGVDVLLQRLGTTGLNPLGIQE